MKRPLDRYAEKRSVHAHAGARPEARQRAARPVAVRRPEARGAPPALRLPPRARRRAQVVGGPEGPVAAARRQAPRGRSRGSSVRLRLVRRRDPRERVRRRQRHRLGLRRVLAGRGAASIPSAIASRRRSGCATSSPTASSASSCAARSSRARSRWCARPPTSNGCFSSTRIASSRGNDVLARNRSVLSGRTLDDLDAAGAAVKRLDADRARADRADRDRCRRNSSPCSPRSARSRAPIRQWLYEPKLDGYRVIAFVGSRRRAAAVASRHRPDRGVSRDRRRPRRRRRSTRMILDGEIVALDADGRPSFNALQNRAQLKTRRRSPTRSATRPSCWCVSTCCISPASTCAARRTSTGAAICRNACCRRTHIQLVHASDDAETAVRSVARQRLRRHRRQAQGQHLSARQALHRVAEDQVDADGGVRRRRLHEGQGRARAAGRAAARLLARAASCTTPVTSAPGSPKRIVAGPAQALRRARRARRRRSSRSRRCIGPTTWLEPRARRRSDASPDWTPDGMLRAPVFLRVRDDVDARRDACKRARRRRREARRSRAQADADAAERSRRGAAAARRQGEAARPRGRRREDPAHQSRSRVLAGRPGHASSRRSPSAISSRYLAARVALTCCRT